MQAVRHSACKSVKDRLDFAWVAQLSDHPGDKLFIVLGDALKVALESYRFNKTKIQQCDCWIQRHLSQFQSRAELTNSPEASPNAKRQTPTLNAKGSLCE